METEFKTWAIVEVMGHNKYAGFVSAETIAGAPMLRVDVPGVPGREPFTKYLSPSSLYGISPCTEKTATLRAASLKKTPFESWSVEQQVMNDLRAKGKLVEHKQLSHEPRDDEEDGYREPNDDDDGIPWDTEL